MECGLADESTFVGFREKLKGVFMTITVEMKSITFAAAFVLTILIVLVGTLLYPMIFGPAVTSNSEYVFGFFVGTFFMLLFLAWLLEKAIFFVRKPMKKK